ncbi:MAG TPA: hypothetical protein VFR02_00965 [bacterium]|nr:hypothetical protein [bacterium]
MIQVEQPLSIPQIFDSSVALTTNQDCPAALSSESPLERQPEATASALTAVPADPPGFVGMELGLQAIPKATTRTRSPIEIKDFTRATKIVGFK